MSANYEKAYKVMNEVCKVVIGKNRVIKQIMASIIAGGHVLLEDMPGVGKTTMAMAFSRAMECTQRRMQFTPDVMPSDVVGFNILNNEKEFEYKPGAIFCNLFLADEINRTSPKTQSALLEVMEEGRVTVDGVTRPLPEPFFVLATQNPSGSAGTQLLPESQLDRFMIKVSMGYPDLDSEFTMLKSKVNKVTVDTIGKIISKEELIEIKKEVEDVFVSDEILKYIAALCAATRKHPHIRLGVSPRGGIALLNMSKAMAFLNGRNYVIPEDVMEVATSVMGHRIIPNTKARVNNVSVYSIIDEIFKSVQSPRIK